MSRSHALQGRARYRNRAVWERAFVGHAGRPARADRRTERAEVEAELADLEVAAWDPDVLLWGGALATEQDAANRGKRLGWWIPVTNRWDGYYDDMHDYYPSDSEWDEYTGDLSCPCCDSYSYHDWDDDDSYWSDDPTDAGWVVRWVDGEVDTPMDWRDNWYETWYEPDEDWCPGCGELPQHCENLPSCTYGGLPETCDEYDARMARLDAIPGDLYTERLRERAVRSSRRKDAYAR